MNKKLLTGIVILIVIAAAVYYVRRNQPASQSPADETIEEGMEGSMEGGESLGLRIGNNAVYLAEQKLGNTASVNMVTLESAGFVVIHELVDGKPGPIIGHSSLLPAGQSNKVPVILTTNLVEERQYSAMLHLDDGDGTFDAATDGPAAFDGSPIMMNFEASPDGGNLDEEVML